MKYKRINAVEPGLCHGCYMWKPNTEIRCLILTKKYNGLVKELGSCISNKPHESYIYVLALSLNNNIKIL